MKTIIDAVNEYKGEWPYTDDAKIIHSSSTNPRPPQFSDYYGTGVNSTPNSSWYLICSKQGFDKCVKNLSATSKIVDVIVSDEEYARTNPKPVFTNCTSHGTAPVKPVFTQEMADNGELPKVNVPCLYKENGGINWFRCEVICYDGAHVWLRKIGTSSKPLKRKNEVSFKSICHDEHLVDGGAYSFDYDGDTHNSYYRKSTNRMFYNYGFISADVVTNITKLTPEK